MSRSILGATSKMMLPPNRVHNKSSFSISSIIASDEPKEANQTTTKWNGDDNSANGSSYELSDSSDVYSSCSEEDIDMADETKPLELVAGGKTVHLDKVIENGELKKRQLGPERGRLQQNQRQK